MRSLRHRIHSVFILLRVMGVIATLRFIFYHIATSPFFWEWMLVKKVRGKRLVSAMGELAAWQSEALVSVVLPVNNGRTKGVERLVASIKRQTHKNIEFIAVDSGSTDDTVAWLKGEGFNVIEIEPSYFTHAYSRNTGASAARGDYLLFTVDDAVFCDPDWLRAALYLMHRFEADSMSSRQGIDDHADAYARCLDTFLSSAQSDQPGVNVSRNHLFGQWMRRILPLRTQMQSVSIDDTNHLVRRKAFERVRFDAPTVEDLEFALNLTQGGGRTLYTNLIFILHYHVYDETTLAKYARRVFIDTKVIGRWQPYVMSFASRESFLVAALHALGVFLHAFQTLASQKSVNAAYLKSVLRLSERLNANKFGPLNYRQNASFQKATLIFKSILGATPPSDLHYETHLSAYFMNRLSEDLQATIDPLFSSGMTISESSDIKTVFLFLWVNRVMSHMARPNIFQRVERSYPCDDWNIGNWE